VGLEFIDVAGGRVAKGSGFVGESKEIFVAELEVKTFFAAFLNVKGQGVDIVTGEMALVEVDGRLGR